jgi:hypothetical protein
VVGDEKKRPPRMSICARMNIVGATAVRYGTHLTTDLDVSTQNTASQMGYFNVMPLSNKLSIDSCAVSKTCYGV